jgi:hypothetical protein
LICVYFLNYFIFLKDEEITFSFSNKDIQLDENSTIELNIANFNTDNCTVTYCELNNCDKSVQLPCKTLSTNDFNGLGMYEIHSDFGSYLLYPWSEKQQLKNWSIESIDSQVEQSSYIEYLNALKLLLKEKYLWEVSSIPLSQNVSSFDNFFKLETVNLNWEYTKSLYNLNILSTKLKDDDLVNIFNKEIDYLNKNRQDIIETTSLLIPNPYILELTKEGLSEDFLSLNSNFSVPNYFDETLNPNAEYKNIQLANTKDLYDSDYQDLVMWADFYKIFKESGNTELANYSKSQMFNIYTNTKFSLYGLCSVLNADPDSLPFEELKNKLEPIFSNDETELIEINIYELMMCKEISAKNNQEIEGLDKSVSKLLDSVSLDIDGNLIIVRGLSPIEQQESGPNLIINYNLLDNLLFLMNYYEE